MAPAPAVDAEGQGGGSNSQNETKFEDDGGHLTPSGVTAGCSPVLGVSDSSGLATAVCAAGVDSSRDLDRTLDVDGERGGGKSLSDIVVNSEPLQCEGGGAFLAPCTEPARADDPVGGASSSDDLAVASSEQGGDSTECSSSFGDSSCETDDEADLEVNSPFSAHAHGDQASAKPRKKKVTAEWRNVVRPMLWRCQWLELRMKDLLSQVSKYDRQLALIKQEKELQQVVNLTNGSGAELGKLCKVHEKTSMPRRKRKRHEDIVDDSLYIKKHQILSYFYDKQNKGAEDGLLIDDGNNGPGGRDATGLPSSKEYDVVSEQFMLQKILLKIGGIQSHVHLLKERLNKALSEQANMASFMDHSEVKVAEKRQRTQKRSFSYKDRYVKPQKKKNLNILLGQEDRPTLAVLPTLPERATDCLIEDAKGNSQEKDAERTQSHKKAVPVDLLLGVDSSLPNGHMGDLCKENTDDILIDNQAAEEGYQPFENTKHPPELIEKVAEAAPSKVGSTSVPVKVENLSAPLEVDDTCAPVVKQEPVDENPPAVKLFHSGKKRGRKPTAEDKVPAVASKKQSKRASRTAKQKTENAPPTAEEKVKDTRSKKQKTTNICSTINSSSAAKKLKTRDRAAKKTGISSSGVKKMKTENLSSSGKRLKTRNSSSDAKKQAAGSSSSGVKKVKTENLPSSAKKLKTGNLSSDAKKQTAGNSSSAAKRQAAGSSSSAVKKQAAGNSSSAARKETAGENTQTNLRIEKAVLVEVNSRRSQRVRKPKVY